MPYSTFQIVQSRRKSFEVEILVKMPSLLWEEASDDKITQLNNVETKVRKNFVRKVAASIEKGRLTSRRLAGRIASIAHQNAETLVFSLNGDGGAGPRRAGPVPQWTGAMMERGPQRADAMAGRTNSFFCLVFGRIRRKSYVLAPQSRTTL